MKLTYSIKQNDTFFNLRDVLKSKFHISDRLLGTLKNNNAIFLNNTNSSIKTLVKAGDLVCVSFDYAEDNSNIVPSPIPLNILYEDDWLLVINKQPGFPVHPSMLHFEDSISNGVKYYFDNIGLRKKIRPVNRLDRDTSGIVIFAKNEYVQERLISQMQSNTFIKEYLAVCEGTLPHTSGRIDAPIARKSGSIIERCIDTSGDYAVTNYDVVKNNNNFSLVHLILETGRTHQIRVHLSSLGCPIVGDTLYGKSSPLIGRQALHSCTISFTHPVSGEKLKLQAPLHNDMNVLINSLFTI